MRRPNQSHPTFPILFHPQHIPRRAALALALIIQRENLSRDLAVRIRERPEDEYQLVEYRSREPREAREVLTLYDERERERSPPRNVLRVEKDRKDRRNARIVAAAMATLT